MIRGYARPYAKAILEVVTSPEQARTVSADLARFETTRRSSQPLADSMENPAVGMEARLGIIRELSGRLELSPLAGKILEVLTRNHRINQLGSVLEALNQMINDEAGISVARVRAAHALDEAQKNELRSALEQRFGKKIELEISTDPELIGGFVAQIGSEIYDASVRGRIDNLRESLV